MPLFAPLVVVLALMGGAQGVVQELDKKDLVVIDGEKDPSQIPEWLAWETAFTLLQGWHGRDNGFTHDLRESLLPREWELLEQEGLAQNTRQARREQRAARWAQKYPYETTTDPAVVARANDEAFAIDLDYRREMLDARDRLLAAFSSDSQVALFNWLQERKASVTAFVRKPDLERWRLPE
jgi:hypothetical protein